MTRALNPLASAPKVYLSQEIFISCFQGDRHKMEPLTLPLNCALHRGAGGAGKCLLVSCLEMEEEGSPSS